MIHDVIFLSKSGPMKYPFILAKILKKFDTDRCGGTTKPSIFGRFITSGHLLSFVKTIKKILRYLLARDWSMIQSMKPKSWFIDSPFNLSKIFQKNRNRPLPNGLNYQIRKVLMRVNFMPRHGEGDTLTFYRRFWKNSTPTDVGVLRSLLYIEVFRARANHYFLLK